MADKKNEDSTKSSEKAASQKRLKNLKPFKKGQSGNPKGYKKGTKNLKTVLREFLELEPLVDGNPELKEELAKIKKELNSRKITHKQLMLVKLIQKASSGDLSAINMVFDRIEGKPVQTNKNENVELSYEDYLESLPDNEDE